MIGSTMLKQRLPNREPRCIFSGLTLAHPSRNFLCSSRKSPGLIPSACFAGLPSVSRVVHALKGDGSLTGSVRASLMSRGIAVVDFRSTDTPTLSASSLGEERPETTTAAASMAAAAAAVSRELFRRGMLSAAWEVGPAMAAIVLQAGHVQRALIRRRRIPGGGGADAGGASSHAPAAAAAARVGAHVGQNESVSGSGKGVAGGSVKEEGEEEEVLRVMRRLSGREGVRVRRRRGIFPWGPDAESCIEVLLPTTPLKPPASA